jgi:tRNA nucleotidyltransferase (CCA-adding enzyme)
VELLERVRGVVGIATEQGKLTYLVGGAVRDLILGRPTLDLDLVVEGDALDVARQVAQDYGRKVRFYPHFGTAKLKCGKLHLDLATARAEIYDRPGALPTVRPSSIEDDLSRRDFTINAMAVHLNPPRYGELLDPMGGESDLEHKIIRILHPKSFIDDATRILRALRYEQRLGFHLEQSTEELMCRNTSMLNTVSGDRIRHELNLILREKQPEKVLGRADGLGVLAEIHPSLKGNGWLAEKFEQARSFSPSPPPSAVYLSLATYHFTETDCKHLINRLKIPRKTALILRDTLRLKMNLDALTQPELPPSLIHQLLRGYSPQAILVSAITTDSDVIRRRLRLYLDKLCQVKTSLDGKALKELGVPEGAELGELLQALRNAKLNGIVDTREEELNLVRQWLSKPHMPSERRASEINSKYL